LTTKILSSSAYSHVIAVPQAKIDIADWLFNLAEAEYQRCCPAGSHKLWFDLHRRRHPDVNQRRDDWTDTDDPALCRGDRYSASLPHDLHVGMRFTPNGRTRRLQIIWTLSVKTRRRHSLRIYQQRYRPSHGGVHGLHRRA